MSAPHFITGLGGSGTRMYARWCSIMGLKMGGPLNAALDYLPFTSLFKQQQFFEAHEQAEAQMPLFLHILNGGTLDKQQLQLYRDAVERSLVQMPFEEQLAQWKTEAVQVIKEPNLWYFYHIINRHLESSKWHIIIRHPFYMARSDNQQQLQNWGSEIDSTAMSAEQAALAFWILRHTWLQHLLPLEGEKLKLWLYDSDLEDRESAVHSWLHAFDCTPDSKLVKRMLKSVKGKAYRASETDDLAQTELGGEALKLYAALGAAAQAH